jgi:hypothetical protein
MNIKTRIRKIAAAKTKVTVTRRSRSKNGFIVIDPDGRRNIYPNRKTAFAALLAQLRCARVQEWRLAVL